MKRLTWPESYIRECIILVAVLGFYCMLAYFLNLPCPIYWVTGVSCPGCGMTRALFSVLRFDFAGAFYYHPLIFLCIPAIPVLVIVHIKKYHFARKVITFVVVSAFFAVYILRILVFESPVLHFTPENGAFARLFL